MSDAPVTAIVLPTDAVGGTEKRLAEVWVHLRGAVPQRHPLVVSEPLFNALHAIEDFRPVLDAHRADVVVHAPGNRARRSAIRRMRLAGKAEVFHVAMAAPPLLGLFSPTPVVFTIPLVTLEMLNARGQLSMVAGAALADAVDVLDPQVTRVLRARLPWMANRIHNTPGSQIDLERWVAPRFAEKENLIAFCGLLSHAKQAGRFLDVLPELHRGLVAAGLKDVHYALMGRDTDEVQAYARAAELKRTGIPIRAWFEPNPAEVLRKAKVFLSLQNVTNYPSKSLLEAIACGDWAVITDVGDSRLAAKEEFASFVPLAFSATDLLAACERGLKAGDGSIAQGRAFLAERFSIQASQKYYLDLYARAASRAA